MDKDCITLSLISHTNVGKTTLARTLLRRDVGEVRDQAHVTDTSTAYTLIETPGAILRLWDTPGFGDTVRLMRRLRREKDPLGWFVVQVWDRLMDRPMWCSREAARNVRDDADVVLYLVNAAEDPRDAGYVPLELDMLAWIGRPVLLLLNQAGTGGAALVERWRAGVAGQPIVRDVLALDAFTRCWVEEDVLLRRVRDILDGPRRAAMEQLLGAWNARNLDIFGQSCARMGRYLARAAADSEPLADGSKNESLLGSITGALQVRNAGQREAMRRLDERLDRATAALLQGLIADHSLEGDSAARIERSFRDFQMRGVAGISEGKGAVAGAVLTGALGGLAADALSGGLTLGGGMIAGGILGALGGTALARGYRLVGGLTAPSVRWSPEFLEQLVRQVALRYLAVAHYGRGRGQYRDLDEPARWTAVIDAAVGSRRSALAAAVKLAENSDVERAIAEMTGVVESVLRRALDDAYPGALGTAARPTARPE